LPFFVRLLLFCLFGADWVFLEMILVVVSFCQECNNEFCVGNIFSWKFFWGCFFVCGSIFCFSENDVLSSGKGWFFVFVGIIFVFLFKGFWVLFFLLSEGVFYVLLNFWGMESWGFWFYLLFFYSDFKGLFWVGEVVTIYWIFIFRGCGFWNINYQNFSYLFFWGFGLVIFSVQCGN
jgi:hypothetical protein